MSSKKEARLIKKKRKLAALATVTKLNESDKEKVKRELNKSVETDDESDSNTNSSEPEQKRSKLEEKTPNGETSNGIGTKPVILSDEDYAELKRELNQKKRELKYSPKFRLKLFGDSASLSISPNIRTPIFLTDIQHLIMYVLFGSSSPCIPSRWCHLEKASKISHTVVVTIDGLSMHHFSSYESHFENSSKIFKNKLEVIMPSGVTGNKILNEIITAPLTGALKTELVGKYGSLEAAVDATKDPALLIQSIFPMNEDSDIEDDLNENSTFPDTENIPRTQLLMSALQMVDEGYPLPLRGELANRYKDFVLTKDRYKEVTRNSPMFALDCEMCRTSSGMNELTRISIINENHESIYETLVCPTNKIVDYLTPYSGITPQMMKNVTKSLQEVQDDVRRILPTDAILVGQSLQSDLMAMRMMHPYVIDTSVIFNISGDRRRKSKLQALASEFLGETIQKNPLGHDSIEDCSASLKLTKLKLNKGIDFGDAILANRKKFYESKYATEDNDTTNNSTTNSSNPKDRSTIVISSDENSVNHYNSLIDMQLKAKNSITKQKNISIVKCDSNKATITRTCEVALEHALTLSHISIPEKYLNEAKLEKSFKKVDGWLATVWGHVAPNGLCIVLFGNDISNKNICSGLAMIQVK